MSEPVLFVSLLALALSACDPGTTKAANLDADNDGWTIDEGDCNDNDPNIYPGATEVANSKDDDCDNIVDNHLPNVDDDGDGFTEEEGDCNDESPSAYPGAYEIRAKLDGTPEGLDNDCDNIVDEKVLCDSGLSDADDAAYPKAMDICEKYLVSSEISLANGGDRQRQLSVAPSFGVTTPHEGQAFAHLSSGYAAASEIKQPGLVLNAKANHPNPQPDPMDGCGSADELEVNDLVSLKLELEAPSNAQAFSFDFFFYTAEYPEWVCDAYDDTFLALLTTASGTTSISFDDQGYPITVNAGFFDVCPQSGNNPNCKGIAELQGTGYETVINSEVVGGATGWLTTVAPITPGETFTLELIIFDEGDARLDSHVILDNFLWLGEPVNGPTTTPID